MPKRAEIIVAGGAGFIGSHFAAMALESIPGARVTVLDKLTYAANPRNLDVCRKNPRFKFVRGDIADKKLAARIIKPGCMLVNFAAETHVDRSIEDASGFIHTNVMGTQILLEACRKNRAARYLHVSTDEVYGSLERGRAAEESVLAPNSPYAASKAAADLLCRAYFRTYGFPVIVSRCTNNYGPHQFPEKVIPLFVKRAMADQFVPLYGDGSNVRDWIHVRDHCAALLAILKRGKPGEIYNISGDAPINNRQLTRIILQMLGKPLSLIKRVPDRPGHDWRYAIDDRKLRRTLGWKPKFAFHAGLRQTIEWYRDNPRWWDGKNENYYNWGRR